jgi:putative (di)nucleoside polyphosphate hydrolase
MAPAQFFRAGAGAVILNQQGLVLSLERADFPGAWQLPQGGLDRQEEPLAAALRETAEETGILARDLELLDRYPEPLAYELPPEFRTASTGRGQVQYWFLFRLAGNDDAIDVLSGGEFLTWRWRPFAELLDMVADFRRPLYRRLAVRFRKHLV